MRLSASARRARLIRLLLCLSLLAQSLIPGAAAAASGGSSSGKPSPAAGTTAARQEAEAADLPDLEEVRNRPHHEPKAVPPVPSTRRRCPPRNPRCYEDADGAPAATPTPTPSPNRPPRGNPHAASTAVNAAPAPPVSPPPARSLASITAPPLWPLPAAGSGGGLPVFDFSLLDFYRGDGGYGHSDASAAGPLAGFGRGYGGAFPFVQGGASNLAQGKSAMQSTTLTNFNPSGDAWHAVDGNTDGNYMAGTVTHTNGDSQPWWQVDLGAVSSIGNIDLWNRNDCCAERLTSYYVFVSDAPFTSTDPAQTQAQAGVWTAYTAGQAPTHSTLAVNRTGRYVRVQLAGAGILSLAEVQVFAGPIRVASPQGIPPAEGVAWTNAVYVTPSGNTLTKTAGAADWDAGAMSTKAIAGGDGYVEFTAAGTTTSRMLGLSHGDSNQSYTDIDYAIYSCGDGTLQVYEAGVYKGGFGTYATGDRLRVSVAGGTVSYSKNGAVFYTSASAPRYPLLADTSLHTPGAAINNALISGSLVENVSWTNVQGVTPSGNNLAKGGAAGWNNGGASSTRVIAGGDGYAEFTASETNTHRMFGLSRGDSNQDYADIDFAIYPTDGGGLCAFESGINKAYLGTYAAGDRLRVGVEGGQVRYRRNGALLYTSGVAPQYPLLVDTSLYNTGATIDNAVISAPLPSQVDPGGTGLTGRYYDNLDFTGYVTTRLDYTVGYWWDQAAPAPGVGPEEFSVRWTGMVVPRYSETYTFYTTTDDGVRLWVDGQLIIDKWIDQGATEWSGQITLEAGRAYSIRMEFYDRFWGAVAQLRWSSASQAKEIVPQSRLLPCWKGVEQFVTDFYQAVLRRAPTAYELQDWTERLAQAQGEGQQTVAAQALGRTLFGPTGMGAEYYALNPSDTQRFVSDLYWGFLQRAPDAGGSSWWVGEVNSHGRAHGIASFADSVEFKEKVVRLCGTAAASGAGGGDGYNFAAARLDPSNRTGGGDPYSRNYNFSIPLVSLTGRAGLDLGLALTYNSLVWTKDGTGVTFDADRGTPSPGFRLGFPTVQPKFYNPQTQKYAYMLVTPSGERVELRQVGTSNVYESADSSYLQLTEGDMTLRSTDGTQLSFTAAGGEWRCHLVKDRNGNYIGAAYYGDGRIWTVTDTLGRTLTFNYDNYQNLLSITQPWRRETEGNPNPTQDEAHQWATFGYANVTLQPLFSSLAVIGEQPGTVIPALSQVGLDDGSYYKFSYNQWGQVWKVTRYAADSVSANGQPNDSHPLTSTRIDLPGSDLVGASAQADCPRFTQERMWVENGVMNQSAEVTTSYDPWSPNMTSCQVTAPDGTKEISYYGGGYPWQKGLVTIEEARSVGGQVMKTTTLAWEHDGAAAAAYPTNVRVTQTSVTDPLTQPQPLTRTMKVTYTVPADFQGESGYTGTLNLSLPKKVEVCAGSNCSAPLRTTVTDYKVPNLGEYVSRRILGLARNQSLYDGADSGANLRSRVEYLYDQPDDPQNNDTFLVQLPTASPAASQHDGTNYGQSMRWRGNANRVRRYSVDQTNGAVGSYVENRAAFNVTGTLAYAKDPREHKTSLDYADSFFLNIRRTQPSTLQTYAYSTTITNPDGFTATTSYNYDMGVVREVQTPKPNETAIETANTGGPLSRRYYDAAGRVIKSLSVDTGAYTRVVYPARMDAVQSYTLIEAGVEAYAAQVLDGAGRTRAAARSLPGSAGGYAGRLFDYDQMGRLARQSNPTETNATGSTWAATGDDAVYGWLYTQASYDWKGRPRVVTNTDGTTREWTYGGCGCAGGEVVTEAGELVKTNAPPPAPAQARRTRRSYSDVLGRVWKTEVLDWNGSVYATTTTKYDTLDRAVRVRQYAGAAPEPEPVGEGAGYRTMTLAYDGHGRLQSRHTPGQDAGADTAYTYYPDDQVASVTDGRGVKTDYEYNGRHLPKSVKFYLTGLRQGQSAEATDKVTFDYDAAGNRTSMVDGAGGTNYHYDALSRMDWEDRHFTGLAGAYRLSYEYTLAGALRKVTDRLGAAVEYGYDAAGRVKQVTGTNGNAGTYVSGVSYRAWGATGSLTYGNNDLVTAGYDGRLRLKSYSVESRPAQFAHSTAMLSDYSYDADGRVRFADDRMDDRFDRAYSYDQAGRLGEAYSGGQARDFAATGAANPLSGGPYRVSYRYDEFDDLTRRDARYWGASQSTIPVLEAGTGRNQAWGYDADGRLVGDTAVAYKYDAAGRARRVSALDGSRAAEQWADGDGLVSRREERAPASGAAQATYYLRSSVLGGEVAEELDASGGRLRTYVRLGTQAVAERAGSLVTWLHANPVTGARGHSSGDGTYEATAEPDAEGINLGVEDPSGGNGGRAYSPELQMPSVLNSTGSGTPQCTMDGLLLPDCELVRNLLASGAARQCPNNDCGPRRTIYQGRPTLAFFHAYGDGYEGYVPVTGRYIGAGIVSPEATWMTRFLDEVDPNRSYTFEYTDPETGETRTYTAYGSVVSTDLSYWTLNPVSADFTYATWRRLSLEELEPRVNQIANKLTPECLEFVNNLVNTTTGKSYDAKTHLLTDLGKIANTTPSGSVDGSGIFYRSDLHAYGMGGNQGGSLAAGNASISIEGTYSPMKSTLPANIHRDASTIFNELMHAVAAADDFKGTRAFDKMGVVPVESTGKPLPYPQGSTIGPYSNYFHTGIENACKTKQ